MKTTAGNIKTFIKQLRGQIIMTRKIIEYISNLEKLINETIYNVIDKKDLKKKFHELEDEQDFYLDNCNDRSIYDNEGNYIGGK